MAQTVSVASNDTLVNATAYPSITLSDRSVRRAIRVQDAIGLNPAQFQSVALTCSVQGATFGSANLQPQYSLDGQNWANLGSAISANGISTLSACPASAWLRFLVGGTGNITTASVIIG